MKVELAYFKPNGTFYSGGEYETYFCELFNIHKEVIDLIKNKKLPDLCEGHSNFVVLVNVPEHKNNHPILLNTKCCVPYYIEEVLENLPL